MPPPPERIRLFLGQSLSPGALLELGEKHSHYLGHVLRLQAGDRLQVFNGKDGEWLAEISELRKKKGALTLLEQRREQGPEPDLWLVFAPIKHKATEYLAQKATELGVSVLQPVITRHTAVTRVNTERLRANAIEAAEQCERLTVPDVREPVKFDRLFGDWPQDRRLVYGDETGEGLPVKEALTEARPGKWAALTGPEGGFAAEELDFLRRMPGSLGAGLGPRVMRADTAAVAALTCLQVFTGDWNARPRWQTREG